MKNKGLLLHVTSLPTDFGIGDFGPAAYQFVDYMVENGYQYWQILPLYQTGYGNSPYNPLSAFALNPYLISPDLLFEDGLIDLPDLKKAKLPRSGQVPYDSVYAKKDELLALAVNNYLCDIEIYDYIQSNALYLKPYLAYITLCKLYGESDWRLFRPEHRKYTEELYESLFRSHGKMILQAAGTQALASEQLHRLKDYMGSQGLRLIGDMPIYLSYHSAEVWANQELFDLDENGNRLRVAGVPPDAFSETGQLWGNPLYLWNALRDSGFRLFLDRIGHAETYLDKLRLDHFIGYVNYWSVDCPPDPQTGQPELPENGMGGKWVSAVPEDFFAALDNEYPREFFIAEDLGILTGEVCAYRDRYGFPGMIILQFCFEDGIPDVEAYPPERFIYTGTHDNPPVREWYSELAEESPSRENLKAFINKRKTLFSGIGLEGDAEIGDSVHKILAIIAQASGCRNVIIPVQDLLGLGAEARMNIPGTALGNWQWRLADFDDLVNLEYPVN